MSMDISNMEETTLLRQKLKKARDENKLISKALSESNNSFNRLTSELSTLKRVTESVSTSLDEKQICKNLVNILISEATAENCSVMLLSRDGETLLLKSAMGQNDIEPSYYANDEVTLTLKIGEGVAGYVAQTGKPELINDIKKSKKFKVFDSGLDNINSLLCVPIKGKEGIVGVLNLSHPNIGEFSKENERLIGMIVDEAALGLANVRFISDIKLYNIQIEKAQEELIRISKSAALGELAHGIAHEINNPVAVIRGIAEVLRENACQKIEIDPELIAEKMDQIIEYCLRCEDITKGVRNFSTTPQKNLQRCVTGEIVSKSINMARPLADELKIGISIGGNSLKTEIETDSLHVSQVIVNLINNALDACKTTKVKRDIEVTANQNGNSVLFCVTDHGEGIPEENLPKVFDPFFTTRSPGKGTGLGLAISNRIIHSLGGKITVTTGSAGTAFTISLPIKAIRR